MTSKLALVNLELRIEQESGLVRGRREDIRSQTTHLSLVNLAY